MKAMPKSLNTSKRHTLHEVGKPKTKSGKSNASDKKSTKTELQKAIKSQESMKHSYGKESDEFAYTTQMISEQTEFKYIEDDGKDRKDEKGKKYDPNASEMFDLESFEEANPVPEKLDIRGDRNDGTPREKLKRLLNENARLIEVNTIQRNKIGKLLNENSMVKEVNMSLVSKSEVNTQYLSRTIETLQQRIGELNTRLETHQINTIEKEKSIQQLIEMLQDIPTQLHKVMNEEMAFRRANDPIVDEKIPNIHKDSFSGNSFPMRKIQYKLTDASHSIKVLCRVKPDINNRLSVPTSDTIYLPPFKNFERGMGYRLNKVFGPEARQDEIFEEISPILPSCFAGCNVCVITYGQSGSGKTHTMIGSDNEPGLMLLSMQELINIKNDTPSTIYKFHLTILEIYNENIYDLMSTIGDRNGMNLKARVFIQDNGHSVQIKEVSEAEINKGNEFSYYINSSLKRRSNSTTARNVSSSRSHYLVMIRVSGITKSVGTETNRGSLIMCDLAGSENCNGLSDKEQTESKFINRSITMLNRVFDAMYRKLPAIPFRDSKLTHLLKPSLMGNAKCVFIATVCGRPDTIHDTYRTLNVAKKVEMIHYNESLKEAIAS